MDSVHSSVYPCHVIYFIYQMFMIDLSPQKMILRTSNSFALQHDKLTKKYCLIPNGTFYHGMIQKLSTTQMLCFGTFKKSQQFSLCTFFTNSPSLLNVVIASMTSVRFLHVLEIDCFSSWCTRSRTVGEFVTSNTGTPHSFTHFFLVQFCMALFIKQSRIQHPSSFSYSAELFFLSSSTST